MSRDAPPLPRPRWLVVLSTLMFLWAMTSFEDGIRGLFRGPDLGLTERSPAPPGLTEPERLRRRLELGLSAVEREHRAALTAVAVTNVVRALVLLFAVAAIATNDPRGRPAGLAAGAVGIASQVVELGTFFAALRESYYEHVVPVAAELMRRQGGDVLAGRPAHEIDAMARIATTVQPAVIAAFVVAFCLVLLRFFGGPRGRSHYGVGQAGDAGPGAGMPTRMI